MSFSSRSEAACAILLEKYCSNYRAIQGVTCQVEIGGKQLDFRIGDCFVEYHPVMLDRSFISIDALHSLRKALRNVPKDTKFEVYRAVEKELEYQYFKQRRNLLDGSQYRNCELIVCTSEMAFISKVIMRFADRPLPTDQQLETMFKKIKKSF